MTSCRRGGLEFADKELIDMMSKKTSSWAILLAIVLILSLVPVIKFDFARAQATDGETIESETARIAPSGVETVQWTAESPALTPEQSARQADWADMFSLPGPERVGAEADTAAAAAPDAASQSVRAPTRVSPKAPLAPGDAQIYRKSLFGVVIPAGLKSNFMGNSVGQNGKTAFFTGNWFAARSTNGGVSWSYVNAYSGFADFCCDQVTLYDESRHLLLAAHGCNQPCNRGEPLPPGRIQRWWGYLLQLRYLPHGSESGLDEPVVEFPAHLQVGADLPVHGVEHPQRGGQLDAYGGVALAAECVE
jgi:hypothetical protein